MEHAATIRVFLFLKAPLPEINGIFMNTTDFREFLSQLFDHGTIVFRSPPAPLDPLSLCPDTIAALAIAFDAHRLTVAGPPIAFDPACAIAAAELVRQSSWALMNRGLHLKEINKRWNMPVSPTTAAQHLSADLTLRYMPQILLRARALDSSDPLVNRIAAILRRWPLSGVLSDIDDAPLGSLEFAGHPGLMLLYAERLSSNDRPAWRPDRTSHAWNYDELVRSLSQPSAVAVADARNEVYRGR